MNLIPKVKLFWLKRLPCAFVQKHRGVGGDGMKRKRPIINSALILISILLLGWGADRYLHPQFPSKIQGESILPGHRVLEVPKISREVYSKAVVDKVTRLNLFRKERKKYYRPKPPKPKPRPKSPVKPAPPKVVLAPLPPPQPTAPPPQLILTGVMLLGDQKVAIFEGTYSEIRGGKLVQNLKPRRRGYKIGESLGSYKIETIDKAHATLSTLSGNNLILTISKTPPSQKIQKTGNRLIQKNKPVFNQSPKNSRSFPRRNLRKTPNQKNSLNRTLPQSSFPSQTLPPDPSSSSSATVPPAQPVPNIPQRLKRKAMGFDEEDMSHA